DCAVRAGEESGDTREDSAAPRARQITAVSRSRGHLIVPVRAVGAILKAGEYPRIHRPPERRTCLLRAQSPRAVVASSRAISFWPRTTVVAATPTPRPQASRDPPRSAPTPALR